MPSNLSCVSLFFKENDGEISRIHFNNELQVAWTLLRSQVTGNSQHFEAYTKESTKAPYYWPFVRGIRRASMPGGFPSQRTSNTGFVSMSYVTMFLKMSTLHYSTEIGPNSVWDDCLVAVRCFSRDCIIRLTCSQFIFLWCRFGLTDLSRKVCEAPTKDLCLRRATWSR